MSDFQPFPKRRHFLSLALGGMAAFSAVRRAVASPLRGATKSEARPIRALAFDGFTIFDPRAVTAAVVSAVPDRGAALAAAWTNKLFALSWLETAAGRYSGFGRLADAALDFSAQAMGIALTPAIRRDLVAVFGQLPAWPDAAAALERWRSAGIRLAFLSNLEAEVLIANTRRNGLGGLFEAPLSTDRVRAFKPSPCAYAMGPAHFGLTAQEIGFVAFGGWDALGARWFGYRTAWINRLSVPEETLSPHPDSTGPDLAAVDPLLG